MDVEKIRRAVAKEFGVSPETLTNDMLLEDLPNFDSLARLLLFSCVCKQTGKEYPMSAFRELRTFGELVKVVKG